MLGENPRIRLEAAANTPQQFTESPDLSAAVTGAVLGNQESHNNIVDLCFSKPELQVALAKRLGELVYENLLAERDQGAAASV